MNFGGPADSVRGGFGQTQEAHFPLLHELRHTPDCLLDRNIGVHTVLIKQVDRVDAEPLERAFARPPGIFGAAIQAGRGVSVPPHRKLRGDN